MAGQCGDDLVSERVKVLNAAATAAGIQGDYEYIEFDRTKLEELMVNLVEIFRSDD